MLIFCLRNYQTVDEEEACMNYDVVIPMRNGVKFIGQALNSVINQTFFKKNLNCIVLSFKAGAKVKRTFVFASIF